jgi:pilus assembly protein Flp/PilA
MNKMTMLFLNSLIRLHDDESGQGLVEYLLILALVAFAATAGMNSLAVGLNSAFSAVGSILGKYIT